MDRGDQQATVQGVARVGCDLVAKSPNHYLQQEELGSKMNMEKFSTVAVLQPIRFIQGTIIDNYNAQGQSYLGKPKSDYTS